MVFVVLKLQVCQSELIWTSWFETFHGCKHFMASQVTFVSVLL